MLYYRLLDFEPKIEIDVNDDNFDKVIFLFESKLYPKMIWKAPFFKNKFYLDTEQEIYTSHHFVLSSVNFKYNHRFFGYIKADYKIKTYFPGRELVLVDVGKQKLLKKNLVDLDIIMWQVIFGGLNSYKKINSNNTVHFLLFDPLFLKHHKTIYKFVKIFLKLQENSLKFCYFKFKHSVVFLKKLNSVKKNLLKKNKRQLKKKDYNLVIF